MEHCILAARRILCCLCFVLLAAMLCGCQQWMITDRNIPSPPWLVLEGDYEYHDGSTNWELLELREDGTFREYSYGCFHSFVVRDGMYEVNGDVLVLHTTQSYQEGWHPKRVERLKVVRKYGKTHLLPETAWDELLSEQLRNPDAPIRLKVWVSTKPRPTRYKPSPPR